MLSFLLGELPLPLARMPCGLVTPRPLSTLPPTSANTHDIHYERLKRFPQGRTKPLPQIYKHTSRHSCICTDIFRVFRIFFFFLWKLFWMESDLTSSRKKKPRQQIGSSKKNKKIMKRSTSSRRSNSQPDCWPHQSQPASPRCHVLHAGEKPAENMEIIIKGHNFCLPKMDSKRSPSANENNLSSKAKSHPRTQERTGAPVSWCRFPGHAPRCMYMITLGCQLLTQHKLRTFWGEGLKGARRSQGRQATGGRKLHLCRPKSDRIHRGQRSRLWPGYDIKSASQTDGEQS